MEGIIRMAEELYKKDPEKFIREFRGEKVLGNNIKIMEMQLKIKELKKKEKQEREKGKRGEIREEKDR